MSPAVAASRRQVDSFDVGSTTSRTPRAHITRLKLMRRSSSLTLLFFTLSISMGCGDAEAPVVAVGTTDVSNADVKEAGAVTEKDGVATDAPSVDPITCNTDSECATSPCQGARCLSGTCVAVLAPNGSSCDPNGDGCVIGATCTAGNCSGGKDGCGCADDDACGSIDDGNPCNGTLRCVAKAAPDGQGGRCEVDASTVVTCEADDNPCVVSTCAPATGACETQPIAGTPPCDDGKPCTGETRCSAGVCAGGVNICACTTSKDCEKVADPATAKCTGTWYCDLSGMEPACKLDVSTVVSCPKGEKGGCVAPACDPVDGTCKPVAVADKTACDDGSICTGDDHCVAGACVAGTNICPCKSQADCAKQEDGDLCNGTLYCDVLAASPSCKLLPGSVVTCDTSQDGLCKSTTCEPKSGLCKTFPKQLSGGTPLVCDDGNPCSSGDVCDNGTCTSGTSICPCTKDADCNAKQPKNQCLGQFYCDLTTKSCVINPATVVVCQTANDNECTKSQCEPSTGKCKPQALPDNSACDADGNPCTVGDVCAKGTCIAGTNVCVCAATGDCGKFEDGNVCNGSLFCDTSKQPLRCEVNPSTVVTCPTVDDTACAQRMCDAKTGACPIVPVFELESCDADGNPCTAGDRCVGGVCSAGTNLCGCQKDADCAVKEDGNACNGTLICDKSKQPFSCQVNPATVVDCSGVKAAACQVVTCQKKDGKCLTVNDQDNLACSDDNPCTVGDTCKSGSCKGGVDVCSCKVDKDCLQPKDACEGVAVCRKDILPHVCGIAPGSQITCKAPGGACFLWACKAGVCEKKAKNAQGPCDDGDACTTKSNCQGASCKGLSKSCDDSDSCTVDLCASTGTCLHKAVANLPCSDGDVCTTGDSCLKGQCTAGKPLSCDDNQPCTSDACAEKTGCTHIGKQDNTACKLPGDITAVCLSSTCTLTAP